MKISVTVIPNAKTTSIEQTDATSFRIRINKPAKEGKANTELVKTLSKHLKIPKSSITIIKGERSKQKIVEVIE